MQSNFSRVIKCKLASSSVSYYLGSGNHIRWVVEKKCEYKVMVMKWDLFSNLIAVVEKAV